MNLRNELSSFSLLYASGFTHHLCQLCFLTDHITANVLSTNLLFFLLIEELELISHVWRFYGSWRRDGRKQTKQDLISANAFYGIFAFKAKRTINCQNSIIAEKNLFHGEMITRVDRKLFQRVDDKLSLKQTVVSKHPPTIVLNNFMISFEWQTTWDLKSATFFVSRKHAKVLDLARPPLQFSSITFHA